MSKALVIRADTEVVPDGWWHDVVVPWADEQTTEQALEDGDVQLATLEAAWRRMGRDATEFMKGRRYLETRWGGASGEPQRGGNRRSADFKLHASKLKPIELHRFRRLWAGRTKVWDHLMAATDEKDCTRAAVLRAIEGAHVGQNAGEHEWYIPEEYIEAARKVLGTINLDPASTPEANEIVQATTFYTEENNGLAQEWEGTVWMNPPYAQPLVSDFCEKLALHYVNGDVKAALVLVNNATETKWFQGVAQLAAGIAFPLGRVKFWNPEKESAPLQGQAVLYLGENIEAFQEAYREFGICLVASRNT